VTQLLCAASFFCVLLCSDDPNSIYDSVDIFRTNWIQPIV
jgi:hypothetical protein